MEYTISNSKLSVVLTTNGGTLTSIKTADGVEYLWQGDKDFWDGQAPILFPICGALRGGKATLEDGGSISIPKHGFVRNAEWTMVKAVSDRITFVIEPTEEMLEQYPFEFKLYATYALEDNMIRCTFTVENNSNADMPFSLGAHPAFMVPIDGVGEYEDYVVEFEKSEDCAPCEAMPWTGLVDVRMRKPAINGKTIKLSHDLFTRDALILDELRSRAVTVKSEKTTRGVRVEFNDFRYLLIWATSKPGTEFVAIEPWTGLPTCIDESDIFEEKRNTQFLEPGDKRDYVHTITIFE